MRPAWRPQHLLHLDLVHQLEVVVDPAARVADQNVRVALVPQAEPAAWARTLTGSGFSMSSGYSATLAPPPLGPDLELLLGTP